MMRMNFLLVLLMLVCAGCPLTIKPETMTSQAVAPVHKSASEIAVAVFGATDISAKKPIHIADEDFTQALVSSIETSGLFRTVLRDASGKYQLQATFVQLDEQIFGLDMTASMEVNYVLASTTPKKVLWEKGISTTHTTAFGESLISATRLRLATEGAARRNVEQAIQEISKLQLE
jgi:hypothetical protein